MSKNFGYFWEFALRFHKNYEQYIDDLLDGSGDKAGDIQGHRYRLCPDEDHKQTSQGGGSYGYAHEWMDEQIRDNTGKYQAFRCFDKQCKLKQSHSAYDMLVHCGVDPRKFGIERLGMKAGTSYKKNIHNQKYYNLLHGVSEIMCDCLLDDSVELERYQKKCSAKVEVIKEMLVGLWCDKAEDMINLIYNEKELDDLCILNIMYKKSDRYKLIRKGYIGHPVMDENGIIRDIANRMIDGIDSYRFGKKVDANDKNPDVIDGNVELKSKYDKLFYKTDEAKKVRDECGFHSKGLYGINLALKMIGTIYLVEGFDDMIAMASAGYRCVAFGSASFNNEVARQLNLFQ